MGRHVIAHTRPPETHITPMKGGSRLSQPVVGKIHSIETMGLMDGPGVRTVVFLQGCPLRCAYCHNPDTQAMDGPQQRLITPDELLHTVLRQRNYFGAEGGVTFSGGEPLVQGAFLAEAMKRLKLHGINLALDTSGFGDRTYYPEIFPLVDTMLLDVKSFTKEAFRDLTHGSFATYLQFIQDMKTMGFDGQIWVRHVMVPGFTDREEAMDQLVATILPFSNRVDRIEILPYHIMGKEKYQAMGIPYRLEGVPPMDAKEAKRLEKYALNQFYRRRAEKNRRRPTARQSFPTPAKEAHMAHPDQHTFAPSPQADPAYVVGGIDLRKLPLLRHLSVAEFEELAQDIQVRQVKKGETIFNAGDKSNVLYIVCAGQFKIYSHTVDGREQIMYVYNPGDFIGGLNLLKQHNYIYTGQALEDGVICTMSKSFFDRTCLNNPNVLRQILEKSYDRIRWAEELIARLANTNAGIKVAELLLGMALRYGEKTPEGTRIELSLSREEMGSYAGLTRETFTRKLGEFKELGYIDFSGTKVIFIKQEEALRDYISAL